MNERECRQIVNTRSDGLCERCGLQGHSIHHRRKRSAGGPWTPSNCVRVCGDGVRGCHGWIESHPLSSSNEGFHVRTWESETKIPVLRFGEWELLHDDGTTTVVQHPESEYPHGHR